MPDQFTWLTAPGLAALSVLHLHGEGAASFLAKRGWREKGSGTISATAPKLSQTPRHVWLKNARGEALDEVMVAREDGGFTVTCHGGPAVRAAFEAELRAAGFVAGDAADLPLFGAATRYRREILRLITIAQSDKGVEYCLWAWGNGERALDLALEKPSGLPELVDLSEDTRFFFDPLRVHLWGLVNAGKSSLLNALCGEKLAAVGDEPGLTRDVLEGRFEHEGCTIRVFDTPGEIVVGTELEQRAFREARERTLDSGDLVLYLVPPGGKVPDIPGLRIVHSRADEGAPEHLSECGFPCAVSSHDPSDVAKLKSRITLTQVPRVSPERGDAFALSAELRNDLRNLMDGKASPDDLRRKWL